MKIFKEDQEKIISLYTQNLNYTGASLARLYQVSPACILQILKKYKTPIRNDPTKLTPRKYTLNQTFFDKINTEEKAYFLGLLYADGYNNENRGQIELTLQEEDKDILEKFNISVDCNRPLLFMNRQKYNKNNKNCFKLILYSGHFCQRLTALGCMRCKSLILKFPTHKQVPQRLIRHFIRGYFDGDGCIYTNPKTQIPHYCCIVSTTKFCKSLKKIFDSIGIISKIYTRNKNGITGELFIHRKANILKFCSYIYKNSSVKLNRKHQKYLKSCI